MPMQSVRFTENRVSLCSAWPNRMGTCKSAIFIRGAFDTASRQIDRHHAADLLRRNRSIAWRVPSGTKFLIGCEPFLISHQPILRDVNF